MSNQKLLACPKCGYTDWLSVYKYESKWVHVECDNCYYLGPGEGSVKQAIRTHNERRVYCDPAEAREVP